MTTTTERQRRWLASADEGQSLDTPIGTLGLYGRAGELIGVRLPGAERPQGLRPGTVTSAAARQIEAYFAGRRRNFDLPLALGLTPFQQRALAAVAAVPFGATASYGEIARTIGSPGAARAVGLANHVNPLAIVIPCHRIVGASGALTGYASGLDHKRWLLAHEGSLSRDATRVPMALVS